MRSVASSSLLCLLVVGAASAVLTPMSARAAPSDATKIVLGSFGEKGSGGQALRDALELELVVREDILLADPDELLAELDGDDLGSAPPSRVGRALDALGQDGLLRAESRGRTDVVVFLVRAPDGQVVYGRRVEVAKTKDDVSGELLDDLGRYLRRVREMEPLTAGELQDVEGDEGVLAGEGLPKKGVIHDPADETPIVEERPKKPPPPPPEDERTQIDEPARPPPKKLSDIDKPAPRDFDIVRASLSLSPAWFTYRACPPATPGDRAPFNCKARSTAPPIEVKAGLVPSMGLTFKAELAPVSFFAFDVDTTMYLTSVGAEFPAGSKLKLIIGTDTEVGAVSAFGGTTGVGMVLRYGKQLPVMAFQVGVRGGYRAFYTAVQAHKLEIDGVLEDKFTLLPSSMSHAAAIGASGSVTLAQRVRIALELDLLPFAAHFEAPTQVASDALMPGLGAHGKASVDVDVVAGVFVTGAGAVDALNATGEGEGSRLTRGLTKFTGGQVDFWIARIHLGVGYRF